MGEGYRLMGEVIGGVLGGLGLGWVFDHFVHTTPFGLVVGLLLGTAASAYAAMKSATPPKRGADEKDGTKVIVCVVGKTTLLYDARAIDDLRAMLVAAGDWVELGSADEQKPARDGTVEAWGRSADNPIGGWYGLKKGLRGRFGMYLPPLLETLGLAEVEHNPRNNRMRAT